MLRDATEPIADHRQALFSGQDERNFIQKESGDCRTDPQDVQTLLLLSKHTGDKQTFTNHAVDQRRLLWHVSVLKACHT